MYSREEVKKNTLEYFNGDELAANVFVDKYTLKDKQGNLLEKSPEDMHYRMACEFFRIENKYPNPLQEHDIYELFDKFKYIIPGGSQMAGVGNNTAITSLSNCFVIDSTIDSYGGIMRADEEQIQIMKRRGGVGHDLSNLRPAGVSANNSILGQMAGTTLYMDRFSNSTREVAQDGRRGALMLSIDVRHPDCDKFIDAKLKEGKVIGANISVRISDEFMKAVENDEDFIQAFPIHQEGRKFTDNLFSDQPYNELIRVTDNYGDFYIKRIKAKELWNKIIKNAHQSAEPGVLFWDTIVRESPADCYGEQWKTISTNPCFTGDTKVLVADGRGEVDFKTLAEKGDDVLVYSFNKYKGVQINKMRNPRLTGEKVKVFKVILDSGDELRATENHKFYLKSGLEVELKNLKRGDSLNILSRVKDNRESNPYYILHSNGLAEKEHRFIAKQLINDFNKELVVHHIDFNSLNNSLDNLEILTIHEHNKRHNRVFESEGEKNIKYSGLSNEEIYDSAKKLTATIGRRISSKEFIKYGGINISKYRKCLGNTTTKFLIKVADELFDNKDLVIHDPRLIASYQIALKNGYEAKIEHNKVLVKKICENCGSIFWINFISREITFCSQKCAVNYLNKKNNGKNTDSTRLTYKKRAEERKSVELKIYSDLKFELNREPKQFEFIKKCQENSFTPFRSKFSYKALEEIQKDTEFYNHKVVSIEFCGYEDVYNGTVDNDHNFFVGGFKSLTRSGFERLTYCLSANCGEIPLCAYDSCRLTAINLYSYVNNPFTDKATFDYELFKNHVNKAQRLMDDLIDLEIEKIDRILNKIESDPEPEEIKLTEFKLWLKIRQKAIEGRRTGLGITAEADMLAALGLRYGTPEATEFSINIHRILAVESYGSSIQLAKERGAFPIYDFTKEVNNPFIKRIYKELSQEDQNNLFLYGRRNIANLTIAPTGTVSLMTQTTSGIEPLFKPFYKRKRKVNKPTSKTTTDQNGDIWEEYFVIHPKFVEWFIRWNECSLNYEEGVAILQEKTEREMQYIFEQSPYYKATANDIDWKESVRMQGEVQKWIDHSISKTVNLPSDTSIETVDELYRLAWKSSCKGLTIYRDGSREGVLTSSTKEEKKEFEYLSSIKIPKERECDIYHKTAMKKSWMIVVGKVDEKPVEIFAFEDLENHVFPVDITKGTIIKEKSKVYSLSSKDSEKTYRIKNIVDLMTDMEGVDTRKYSLMLRHRINPQFIIDQIREYATITSFDKVIERILSKYVKEERSEKELCPNCKSKLVRQEGCVKCTQCEWSKCG